MDLSVLTKGEREHFEEYQRQLKKNPNFKRVHIKSLGMNPTALHKALKKLGMVKSKTNSPTEITDRLKYKRSKMISIPVESEKPCVALIGSREDVERLIKNLWS